MASFWVTFRGRNSATVNAKTEDEAKEIAAKEGEVEKVHIIPYPRDPQLNPGSCPAFCYGRSECLGKTACPQRRACTE